MVNFLKRRSRSREIIYHAMIYNKTSSPHECQCPKSISVIKVCMQITYVDVSEKELLIDVQI